MWTDGGAGRRPKAWESTLSTPTARCVPKKPSRAAGIGSVGDVVGEGAVQIFRVYVRMFVRVQEHLSARAGPACQPAGAVRMRLSSFSLSCVLAYRHIPVHCCACLLTHSSALDNVTHQVSQVLHLSQRLAGGGGGFFDETIGCVLVPSHTT